MRYPDQTADRNDTYRNRTSLVSPLHLSRMSTSRPARIWASKNSYEVIARFTRSVADSFVRSWSRWSSPAAVGIKATVIRSPAPSPRLLSSFQRASPARVMMGTCVTDASTVSRFPWVRPAVWSAHVGVYQEEE